MTRQETSGRPCVVVTVDIDIYQSEIQLVHPYIVGLSVVGGMCVFDPALQAGTYTRSQFRST